MRKNEMFVIIDSLFSERIDYWIELLLVFRSRFSRVDNKALKFKLDELKKVHCSMQDDMKIKSLIFQIQTIIFCPKWADLDFYP